MVVEIRISGLKAEEAIWGPPFAHHLRVEAQGFTGGIWNLPKDSRGCIHPSFKYMQFIHVRVVQSVNYNWWLSSNYARPMKQFDLRS